MSTVEPLYGRLGEHVRSLRRRKGLTQAELARRLDPTGDKLGRTSVANIEAGRQRIALHTFIDLAMALDVAPEELLPREPRRVPKVAERFRNFPQREQEWLLKVFTEPGKAPRSKRDATPA